MDWFLKEKLPPPNSSGDGDIFGSNEDNLSLSLCWDESGLDRNGLPSPCASNGWDFNTSLVSCVVNEQANENTHQDNSSLKVYNVASLRDLCRAGSIEAVTNAGEDVAEKSKQIILQGDPLFQDRLGTNQVMDGAHKKSISTLNVFPLIKDCPPTHSRCFAQGNENGKLGNVDFGNKSCVMPQRRVQSVLYSPIAQLNSSSAMHQSGCTEIQALSLLQTMDRPPMNVMATEISDFTARHGRLADPDAAPQSRNRLPSLLFPAGLYRMSRTLFFETPHDALTSISLMMQPVPEGPSRQHINVPSKPCQGALENTPSGEFLSGRAPESVPRYTNDAGTSRFCHCCGKRRLIKVSTNCAENTIPTATPKMSGTTSHKSKLHDFFAECSNREIGLCRKAICGKCISIHDLLRFETAKDPKASWVCLHCLGICPPRARCQQYKRHNVIRRKKNEKARASNSKAAFSVGCDTHSQSPETPRIL